MSNVWTFREYCLDTHLFSERGLLILWVTKNTHLRYMKLAYLKAVHSKTRSQAESHAVRLAELQAERP